MILSKAALATPFEIASITDSEEGGRFFRCHNRRVAFRLQTTADDR